MSCRQAPERQPCNHRSALLRRAAPLLALSSSLWLSACSSVSSPAIGATPPGGASSSSSATSSNLVISSTLPAASVGAAYNASVIVTGGTAPYKFSLASGQLPSGILLADASGAFSGTPSTSGSFPFSLSVTDAKGLSDQQSLQLTVAANSGSSGHGTTPGQSFSKLQQSNGWASYGQGPPDFIDCSPSPCDGIAFSMKQGVTSPSLSGSSTQFNLSGTAVYTDALFNNHLIGAFSSQGLPDTNQTLVPTLHNFTYDVYFYGTNLELSQAVEFDINQFFNNQGFIWGHECRVAGGHEWDIWDNLSAHWVPTGIACNPVDNQWNHLTIQVQRTSSNQLLYQSITLNGVTSAVNQYYNPGSAVNWYGVTINYQMDGNSQQSPYSVYLDNLTFIYE